MDEVVHGECMEKCKWMKGWRGRDEEGGTEECERMQTESWGRCNECMEGCTEECKLKKGFREA